MPRACDETKADVFARGNYFQPFSLHFPAKSLSLHVVAAKQPKAAPKNQTTTATRAARLPHTHRRKKNNL